MSANEPFEMGKNELQFRLVQDNFVSPEECATLTTMTDQWGKVGDGYGGNPHPHTPNETFSGYSLDHKSDTSVPGHHLGLQIMERTRRLMMQHYKLRFLWLDYGHIVLREAIDRKGEPVEELSHPWHFDNQHVSIRHRSHTAIVYLNDNFTGGNTCFREADFGPFREVRPKPGRIVSFNVAKNAHAVTKLHSGKRYVFNMWFCTHWSKWRAHRKIFKTL